MEEEALSGEEKQQVYARLKANLKRALAGRFWMEATMIEYNIIEDRTASILQHAGITNKAGKKSLSNKLNSIELQLGKRHPIISLCVMPETIEDIRAWKGKRNAAVHKACSRIYHEDTFRTLAEEGKELADRISNESQRVKRAIERREKSK